MQQSTTNPEKALTKVPQLRISVTVPCGKKCVYCRPGGEGFEAPRSAELTPAQFAELARMFVRGGVRDIKLTGGDPMLRKDIVEIVRLIKQIDGYAACTWSPGITAPASWRRSSRPPGSTCSTSAWTASTGTRGAPSPA